MGSEAAEASRLGSAMEAVYEMIWDCKYCGQKKLLGLTHRFCAGCGAPQDPAARYFPPENEKVAVHDHPFVGADVACPACKQPMSRAAKCCTNCGSPIDKGVEVARRADVVVPPGGAQGYGYGHGHGHGHAQGGAPGGLTGESAFAAGRYGPDAAPTPMNMAATPAAKKSFPVVLAVVGAVVGLLVMLVLVAVFWKREGVFEVTGHTWERSIAVERFDVGRRTAWCDDRPPGGRELSRRREQRSTKQVRDGETCQTRKKDQGNGTYKEVRECQPKYRSEPVYSDRCEFEVTEWRTARTLAERGTSPTDPPRWPAVVLVRPGTCLGCEREGPRSEKYTVKFVDTKGKPGDDASCDLPEGKWSTFAKGSKWRGKVRVLTGGVECEALVRQ